MGNNVGTNLQQQNIQINNQQQYQYETQVEAANHPTLGPFVDLLETMVVSQYGDTFGNKDEKKLKESDSFKVDIFEPKEEDIFDKIFNIIAKKCDDAMKLLDENYNDNNPFKELCDTADVVEVVNKPFARKMNSYIRESINQQRALEEGFVAYTA